MAPLRLDGCPGRREAGEPLGGAVHQRVDPGGFPVVSGQLGVDRLGVRPQEPRSRVPERRAYRVGRRLFSLVAARAGR